MSRRLIKGAILISSINVVRLLVQFISVPLLARLLSPEEYGLAFMAMPFLLFVMMLADCGLGSSIIRSKDAQGADWHSCFWVSIAFGLSFTALIALGAPIAGHLQAEPRLTPLVLALSICILAQTITLVPGAALQKSGMFGTISVIEIISLLVGVGTAIFTAISGAGVWALIFQQVTFYITRAILTTSFSNYKPRLVLDLKSVLPHVVFGWHLLGINLIGFISRSVETLAIGRVAGAAALGIYSMAFQFARLPSMLVTGPLQYVLYPHAIKLKDNPEDLKRLFLSLTCILATLIFPGMYIGALASDSFFHILLSPKWIDAAPIFTITAIATGMQAVTSLLGTFLMAIGRTDVQARVALQTTAVSLVGLLVSVWFGIEAIAATYSACAILCTWWSLRIYLPLIGCSLAEYSMTIGQPVALTATSGLVYFVIEKSGGNEWQNMAIAAAVAACSIFIGLANQRNKIILAFKLQ